jgi:hypothetical protein
MVGMTLCMNFKKIGRYCSTDGVLPLSIKAEMILVIAAPWRQGCTDAKKEQKD